MCTKEKVMEYFDERAAHWDERMIRDDNVIDQILDNARICEGKDILDVACGTGVLIPDYLKRNVRTVTGIDLSSKMIKVASKKFKLSNVTFVCGDVEQVQFDKKFDCIVMYNAFPHFFEPEKVIKILISYLKDDGILTIAHGMSRQQINCHHSGSAKEVSVDLIEVEALAKMFEPELCVKLKISDDRMYQVVGMKE